MPSSRQPTVYLFDIDGTLLLTGGAGRRAIEAAFDHRTGRRDACSAFSFHGMTDRAIVRAGLLHIGAAVSEERIDELIASYLENLSIEVATSDGYRIMPGVLATLERLRGRPQCALGLGTGNVRRGAAIKLERGNLYSHFTFGGFGCDHEDRAELLRMGAERGAGQLGQPRAACRVVVIGDTILDVRAAQAIGAECIGVGTSGTPLEELQRAGATAVYADLIAADQSL